MEKNKRHEDIIANAERDLKKLTPEVRTVCKPGKETEKNKTSPELPLRRILRNFTHPQH